MAERNAARVIIIDADHSVLLFRGGDPARPEVGTWWFTPGGGVEPGESPLDAAKRELFEESGLRVDELFGPIHARDTEFEFNGAVVRQHEEYFYAFVPRSVVSHDRWTALEQEALVESRWWTLDEIVGADATIYPVELLGLVRDILRAARN